MPARPKKDIPQPKKQLPLPKPNPQVIVDVIFKDGLFFLSIENISDLPARKVSVKWEPHFRGLGGSQATSELALFQNIEFLAPHKSISTLLDSSRAYFQRGEPTRITAQITYLGSDGRTHTDAITHDLSIYKDLIFIQK